MMRNSNIPDVLDDLMNQETRIANESGRGGLEGRKYRSF